MAPSARSWIAWGALLFVAAPASARADEYSQVSVVVNVLKGASEATDAQIKAAIAVANGILHQAGVELNVVKTNRDVSDGGNDDGKVDPDELQVLREKGQEELDAVVGKGKGKGFKLTIARTAATWDFAASGISGHDIPVSIVEHPPAAMDWGWVIAHEFCHAFTLTGHEQPDGQPWGIDNLMHEKFKPGQNGTTLTAAQRAEIKKKVDDRGVTKKQASNASPTPKKGQHGGSGTDKRSGEGGETPGLPPKSDLRRCEMFTDSTLGIVRGNVQVYGLYDSTVATQEQILIYVDTDSIVGTGQIMNVDGRTIGADYRIEIALTGSGGSGGLNLSGQVVRTATAETVPLSSLVLEAQSLMVCFGDSDPDSVEFHQFNFELQRSFLGPFARTCPSGCRMIDAVAGTTDESQFDLRAFPPARPLITLSSYLAPFGASVTVTGTGFTPLTAVTLLADDAAITTVQSNGSGDFVATIPAPQPRIGGYYWINAREPSGAPQDFTILRTYYVSGGAPGVNRVLLGLLAAGLALASAIFVRRRAENAA